jgi:hypothetical protein
MTLLGFGDCVDDIIVFCGGGVCVLRVMPISP